MAPSSFALKVWPWLRQATMGYWPHEGQGMDEEKNFPHLVEADTLLSEEGSESMTLRTP